MKLRHALLAGVAYALAASAALAQVNVVPQVGLSTAQSPGRRNKWLVGNL